MPNQLASSSWRIASSLVLHAGEFGNLGDRKQPFFSPETSEFCPVALVQVRMSESRNHSMTIADDHSTMVAFLRQKSEGDVSRHVLSSHSGLRKQPRDLTSGHILAASPVQLVSSSSRHRERRVPDVFGRTVNENGKVGARAKSAMGTGKP